MRTSSTISTIRAYTIPSVLSLAALVAGCGSSTASDDTGSLASQLDADNGAMTTADEAPAFGDPAIENLAGFTDAQADATDVTADVAARPGAKRYHVALLWGHLPAPTDSTADDSDPSPADWTGSVSVDSGAIRVKKTLLFDGRDSIEPRTNAQGVSFVSHTLPYVDGLYLDVAVPANGAGTLHVDTASLKLDIDLSQLQGTVTRLPNTSNGLAYIGYEDVAGCSRGITFGRWVKTRAALGRFRGQVIDGAGDRIGHVRGIWGHAPQHDANLFFGKYIAADGSHKGLFGGNYAAGRIDGIWGTRDPNDSGTLEGLYSDGFDRDDGRGVYIARWSEKCN